MKIVVTTKGGCVTAREYTDAEPLPVVVYRRADLMRVVVDVPQDCAEPCVVCALDTLERARAFSVYLDAGVVSIPEVRALLGLAT